MRVSFEFWIDSMFKVEARALLEGLLLAWDKGFKKVIAKCDNSLLVDLLSSIGGADSGLVEVWLLHQILHRKWNVCVQHIPRVVIE